jgi:hypothetical protein
MERLTEMSRRVTDGLEHLRSDSAVIARKIRATADDLDRHQRATSNLDDAAAQLRTIASELDAAPTAGQVADEVFQRVFRVYTMSSERDIHVAVLSAAQPAAEAATA